MTETRRYPKERVFGRCQDALDDDNTHPISIDQVNAHKRDENHLGVLSYYDPKWYPLFNDVAIETWSNVRTVETIDVSLFAYQAI